MEHSALVECNKIDLKLKGRMKIKMVHKLASKKSIESANTPIEMFLTRSMKHSGWGTKVEVRKSERDSGEEKEKGIEEEERKRD